MSEAEDFEWNEICAKIAYEEEKFFKGNGFPETPSSSNIATIKTNRNDKSLLVQPYPETYETFKGQLENASHSGSDESLSLAKHWKCKSDSMSWNQASLTTAADFESILMRKQGEISILRERLEKLEKEKFEAIESCRILRQDTHKRDLSLSNSSRGEIHQLQAEVTRLQKLNEFYHQELNSLETNRNSKSFLQEGNGTSRFPVRFDAETMPKRPRNVSLGQPAEPKKLCNRGRNVLDEFETVVNELNQHDRSRPRSSAANSCYRDERTKELFVNESIPGKSYSFQTAISLHIPPKQNTNGSADMYSVHNMNFLSGDDLMSVRRLVLTSEEHLSNNLLRFLNVYSAEDCSLSNEIPSVLYMFMESLLQILESGCPMSSLEDASRVFHSVLLKAKEFCHTLDFSTYISLERILTLVQRIMEDAVSLKIFLNVIEGTVVILEEFSQQRVSASDIESIIRFLRHFFVTGQEEIPLSAESSLLRLLLLIIDILFAGQECIKLKRSLYSNCIFQLGMSFLSSSNLCIQRCGIYFGYKLKEILAFSLEVCDYICLMKLLLRTMIREYLTLLQCEYSMYLEHSKFSSSSQRERSLQRLFGKSRSSWITKSDSILFIHYSLRACHFMINHLREQSCSLNFLLDYSVPVLSMLKAIFQDPRKALGNLLEAHEIWSVMCDIMNNRELH
ncbi:hypothetical protein GpartN1_g1097.t1 [Galdieria partita]|uniref:Uncharacterized protein n=1 Tax=Galdieria partita TaxID=83374 RepID=A0A9C7PRW9_9RHOD|nr:hypothetical protein GpartN1_g1097.t1 [Galdieria partita]